MANFDTPLPLIHPSVVAAIEASRSGDLLGLHALVDWRLSRAGGMVAAVAGIPAVMADKIPELLASALPELDETMIPTRDNRHFIVRPLAAVLAMPLSVGPASPEASAEFFNALRLPDELPHGPTPEQLERLAELGRQAAAVEEVYGLNFGSGELPVGVTLDGLLVVPTLENDDGASTDYLFTTAAPSGFDLETGLPRGGVGDNVLEARSQAEAEVYLSLSACPTCGGAESSWHALPAWTAVDGRTVRPFTGTCSRCGRERESAFCGPGLLESSQPPERFTGFGGPEQSSLVDAGAWLWVAERSMEDVEESSLQSDSDSDALAVAVAAVDEVLKFVPEGSDHVPDEAFWTDHGRTVRAGDPERFTVGWLLEVRATLTGFGELESGS